MSDTVINTNLAALSTGTSTDTQTSTQTSTNPNSMTLQEHMQHIGVLQKLLLYGELLRCYS